jgi:hypothetical protein
VRLLTARLCMTRSNSRAAGHARRLEARSIGAVDEAVDRDRRNPAYEGYRVSQPDRSPHTTTAQGRLVFHMFGALAEFERSLIRERTQAGLAAARRVGRTGGRPPKLTDDDIEAAKAMLANPDIGVTQIAHRLGVSPASSIGTSRPREPQIRRAFDNGRFTRGHSVGCYLNGLRKSRVMQRFASGRD